MPAGPTNARLTARNLARVAVLAASLAACNKQPAPGAPTRREDLAVARLNGHPVWASDVGREAAAQGLVGRGETLDPASGAYRQVIDEVVDTRLLAAEAVRRGLDKDPAARRRLAAGRDRILADILLEQSVGRSLNEAAVNGLYQEMQRNQPPGAAPVTLADARPRIVRFLTYDQVKDLVLDLRRNAKIEIVVPPPPPSAAAQTPAVHR